MKYEKDYYQILGVKRNATPEEIKQAYRRLAIFNHPDKNQTRQAAAQMQEINEAYSVLGDKRKRARYDFERENYAATFEKTLSPNDIDTIATKNLQQIYTEEEIPYAEYVVVSILWIPIFILFLLSPKVIFLRPLWDAFPFISLALIFSAPLWTYWKSSRAKEKESQCPNCGKIWVAEKLGEKMIGIFRRTPLASRENPEGGFVTYGKFKIHYNCKVCSHEWLLIKVKRV